MRLRRWLVLAVVVLLVAVALNQRARKTTMAGGYSSTAAGVHYDTYAGIAGELLLEGEEMTFILGATVECDGRSVTADGSLVR